MSVWVDIKFAPKDRVVDLWNGRRHVNCRWSKGMGYWNEPSHRFDSGYEIAQEVKSPTHFMEIPAPPVEEQKS